MIDAQPRRASCYIEPFAGGFGAGLRLLFDEYVDEVLLNDLNPGMAAFWRSIFYEPTAFAEMVTTCDVTVDEWHRQREVYCSDAATDLELGFATFFLNRTNRSGILEARPIGGLKQVGSWGIDARFDKSQLVARIRILARYTTRVTICEEDGVELLTRYLGDSQFFIYADPPYLAQGDDLYLDTLQWQDHERLANLLRSADGGWFVTYDADPRIPEVLYPDLRCAAFRTSHTAATQHVGTEYAVFARHLVVPSLGGLGSHEAHYLPGSA